MKRIRQYLARMNKSGPLPPDQQDPHHLKVHAKSTTTVSTASVHDNRPSFDEDGPGAAIICEGLPDGKEDENLDIIFVHHAGGGRVKSWTKTNTFWPRDLLAQEFPHARIISWGYQLPSLNKPMDEFGEGLNDSLSDSLLADVNKVTAGSDRSIIFVAHGLGGLIVKDALSTAAVTQIYGKASESSNFYSSTIGVIFLGTPHKGVGKKPLVETIVKTAQLELRQQDETFAQMIRDHVHMLTGQRDEFVIMSRDIAVVCVRELYPFTPMSLMVPKASASYEGLNVAVDDIAADHFDMARFANRRDPGYFQLVGHISKLSRRTGMLEDSEERLIRTKEILDALAFDFRSRQDEADIEYASQCAGVLSSVEGDERISDFDHWCSTPSGPLFWISGNPGSGKTTLMKHAFHSEATRRRLQQWAGNSQLIIASCFLFESGGHLQKSREGILRAILFQVLTARPELVSVCFPSHITGPWPPSSPFNTVVNLTQAFYQLFARMGKTLRLALFIDALDEYRIADQDYGAGESASVSMDGSTEGSSALLGSTKWITDSHTEIATLITDMSNADFIKLCVSSRELPPFEDALAGFPRMRVHTRTEKMISDYCATRLDMVAPGLSAGQKPLCDEVSRKSRGDILWARLAIDLLMEGSLKKLRDTLESLPQQLGGSSGLYMRIIQNLPPVKQRETCRIFELLLRALESPGLVSLAFAVEGYLAPVQQQKQAQAQLMSAQSQKNTAEVGELAVTQDKANPFTPEDLHNISQHMERRMMSCCSGLLETTKSKKVTFMHLTAKEFALRGGIWDKVLVAPPNKAEMDLSLMSANIRYLRCLGTLNRVLTRVPPIRFTGESWLIVANTLRYAHRLDNVPFDTTAYIALLDELEETCRSLARVRDRSPTPSASASASGMDRSSTRSSVPVHWSSLEPMELGQSPRRTSFLALAMQGNLFNYVLSKLMALDYETRRARAQELLEYAVCPEGDTRAEGVPSVSACVSLTGSYKDFHHDLPETRFVQLLFELGADASGATPASRDLWQRTVQSGHRYFTQTGTINALSFNQTPAQVSPQNRQRWVAAVLLLLEHGADPHCQVETAGSGSQLGTDSGSLESRPAIEIIRRTLEGEKEFAGDVIMMEALAVRAPPGRKASRRSMIVVDQLAAPSWQEKKEFGQLSTTLEPPSPS